MNANASTGPDDAGPPPPRRYLIVDLSEGSLYLTDSEQLARESVTSVSIVVDCHAGQELTEGGRVDIEYVQ